MSDATATTSSGGVPVAAPSAATSSVATYSDPMSVIDTATNVVTDTIFVYAL